MSTPTPGHSGSSHEHIAFIGGGNMASAILGGLLKRGMPASQIQVVEPGTNATAPLDPEAEDKPAPAKAPSPFGG